MRLDDHDCDLALEWDDLADRIDGSPFDRPGWYAAWWRAFGQGTPRILQLRRAGRLAGVLPVTARIGRGSTLHNWHSFTCDPIAEDTSAAAELMRMAIRTIPCGIDLGRLGTDAADLVDDLVRRAGGTARRSVVQRSPFVRTTGSFEAYLATRSTTFAGKLRQARRKLERVGAPRLGVRTTFDIRGPASLDPALAEVFGIEAMGWKGEGGSAILSDPRTTAFYTDVARWAADRGLLQITTLRVDDGAGDRAVAAEFALNDGRSHYGLKIGFDPAFRSCGPGFLLVHDLLRSTFERGLETFEFTGSATEEKRRWTDETRPIWRVQAFPGSLAGRSAALAVTGGRVASSMNRQISGAARARLAAARRT